MNNLLSDANAVPHLQYENDIQFCLNCETTVDLVAHKQSERKFNYSEIRNCHRFALDLFSDSNCYHFVNRKMAELQ